MHKEELRAFYILAECYSGDQFEDNGKGWECGTCGKQKNLHMGLLWKILKERDSLEDMSADGRIL
jgi:hypothetical protein